MRKEHKPHVVIISFMMLLVLAVFVFVILNRPASITTSLPSGEGLMPAPDGQAPVTNSFLGNLEIEILLGFLILLTLLFIWYVAIHIAKELRRQHHS